MKRYKQTSFLQTGYAVYNILEDIDIACPLYTKNCCLEAHYHGNTSFSAYNKPKAIYKFLTIHEIRDIMNATKRNRRINEKLTDTIIYGYNCTENFNTTENTLNLYN